MSAKTSEKTPKRQKRAISGWLILDKPYGVTSTQAVGKIRFLFNALKAGHAGTLDPLATGILPIALGEATKTVSVLQGGLKRYRFTVKWGAATTTDDVEGAVTSTSDIRPDAAAIAALLPRFTGEILQRPPAFSAILVDGARAYDLARAGELVKLPARPVVIESLTLIGTSADTADFEMACEKGTYVRALARDLAEALGTYGHVTMLRRIAVGAFTEAEAIDLQTLESDAPAVRDGRLVPVATALGAIPEIRIGAEDALALRHGRPVLLAGAAAPIALPVAWASHAGAAIALGAVEGGWFRPTRVLN